MVRERLVGFLEKLNAPKELIEEAKTEKNFKVRVFDFGEKVDYVLVRFDTKNGKREVFIENFAPEEPRELAYSSTTAGEGVALFLNKLFFERPELRREILWVFAPLLEGF